MNMYAYCPTCKMVVLVYGEMGDLWFLNCWHYVKKASL